jgi:hypothetical protein
MMNVFKHSYSIEPEGELSFDELCDFIRTGYTRNLCIDIRESKSKGKDFSKQKKSLPAITPHCTLKQRKISQTSDFEENFKAFSGYFYFDFDIDGQNPYDFKKRFTETYKGKVSLVCVSSTEGGIGILVKVDKPIQSVEHFYSIRQWIIENIFHKEKYLDSKASDLGRLWYISYDPEVFIDREAFIEIPEGLEQNIKGKSVSNQYIIKNSSTIYTDLYIQLLDYDEISKLRLSNKEKVKDPFFDFEPREMINVRHPQEIKDGNKHRIFHAMILGLLELNPDKPDLVYTYMHRVNSFYTGGKKMSEKRLKEVFLFAYEKFHNQAFEYKGKKTKMIHFAEAMKIDPAEKNRTANVTNGARRRLESYAKVQNCIEQMRSEGQRISVRSVMNFCRVGNGTARNYINAERPDLEGKIQSERARLALVTANIIKKVGEDQFNDNPF